MRLIMVDMDAPDLPETPLDMAIKAIGSQESLAAALGIKSPSISEWRSRGFVPPKRVLDIERLTGISRHDLRPDIYPRERRA